MKTFKDTAGNNWTLDVNGASLKRVRKLLDVDLTELEKGTPPLGLRLERDPVLVCDVLYVLLQPDVEEKQMTDEAFGQALGKEGLRDGRIALAEELTDFFRQLGLSEQAKILETQAAFMKELRLRSVSKLESLDLNALIDNAAKEAEEKLKASGSPSGSDSKSSEASSASIPTSSVSAP